MADSVSIQVFEPIKVPVNEIDVPREETVLIARYPGEMAQCQTSMILWCRKKIEDCKMQTKDLADNLEIAKRSKWRTSALAVAHKRAENLEVFYMKVLAALEMGYCLVPNFPLEVFAIRTKKKNPRRGVVHNHWNVEPLQQNCQALPIGDGQWVNDDPILERRWREESDGKGGTKQYDVLVPKSFNEVIDFPFVMTKPKILEATERAMVSKIFDDLGILPANQRKGDPMVIGRIKDPRSTKYDLRFLSFLVCWFVDVETL